MEQCSEQHKETQKQRSEQHKETREQNQQQHQEILENQALSEQRQLTKESISDEVSSMRNLAPVLALILSLLAVLHHVAVFFNDPCSFVPQAFSQMSTSFSFVYGATWLTCGLFYVCSIFSSLCLCQLPDAVKTAAAVLFLLYVMINFVTSDGVTKLLGGAIFFMIIPPALRVTWVLTMTLYSGRSQIGRRSETRAQTIQESGNLLEVLHGLFHYHCFFQFSRTP